MKVCTDACLQGAFAAKCLQDMIQPANAFTILDIGTGTGLLSLILAQTLPQVFIDAIELDKLAAEQVTKNVSLSLWNNRIEVRHEDVRTYSFDKSYDFMICNPPFYENDLKSVSQKKNLAKHGISLNYNELLTCIQANLKDQGSCCIMIPYSRSALFVEKADEANLYPGKILRVKQSPEHQFFRTILFLHKKRQKAEEEELCIVDEEGKYTTSFTGLLKPYYLHL